MASDYDEISHADITPNQSDFDFGIRCHEFRVATDSNETVGTTEARNAATALTHRIRRELSVLVFNEPDQQILKTAPFALGLNREPCRSSFPILRRLASQVANQGRNEFVKCKDR